MNRLGRILVVEDDEISRNFFKCALCRRGFEVVAVESAMEAWDLLSPAGIGHFDCVVTDYRMPGSTGLDLLSWIQKRDPHLATIIVTAEGEKHIVTDSLRGGAVNFLDKPVGPGDLHHAVTTAVKRTDRQRRLDRSDAAVKRLGRAQQRMLVAEDLHGPVRVEICFHPKHEAGGDFFSRFHRAPGHFCCLLTDVSGHDLQAAYISAHFQGIVRGMLEQGAPMEKIFATFNRLLLEEWNNIKEAGPGFADIKASIAACAISIDATTQSAAILSNGMPAPVYWLPHGEAKTVGDHGCFPLGWFAELNSQVVIQAIPSGGVFSLWTDGLEDLAEKQGVSELSMACALLEAKRAGHRLAGIDAAEDDVLVAEVWLSPEHIMAGAFRPLLLEHYPGDQSREIDHFQAHWERSLKLAVPGLPDSRLHDILLAAREAVLNALKHGCQGCFGQTANFQAGYCSDQKTIRLRVSDPGLGHHFDPNFHTRLAAGGLRDAHRGLLLIQQLADRLEPQRNGATLIMDFAW